MSTISCIKGRGECALTMLTSRQEHAYGKEKKTPFGIHASLITEVRPVRSVVMHHARECIEDSRSCGWGSRATSRIFLIHTVLISKQSDSQMVEMNKRNAGCFLTLVDP